MVGTICMLLAASALHLRYVVIVSRHGVRAPAWDAARLNQYSDAPWPAWGVPPGNLTPHGRALITQLGAYYRERFAVTGCAGVDIRADSDQRTLETARAFSESMLPGCAVDVRPLPTGADGLIESARARLETMRAQHSVAIDALGKILGRADSLDLATASELSENLLLEYAEGMRGASFGWGRATRENLLVALGAHRAYADIAWRARAVARVRGAKLMSTILQSMESASGGVLLIVGHDTDQSALAGMLGLTWSLPGYLPDEMPPGGAIIFSLWSDASGKTRYVRTEFVAQTLDQMHDALKQPPVSQTLLVAGCPNDPLGCPWETFRDVVAKAIR